MSQVRALHGPLARWRALRPAQRYQTAVPADARDGPWADRRDMPRSSSQPRRTSHPLNRLLERTAHAVESGDADQAARLAQAVLVEASRFGHSSLLRHAALLLSAAERQDTAAAVVALVHTAHAWDQASHLAQRAA